MRAELAALARVGAGLPNELTAPCASRTNGASVASQQPSLLRALGGGHQRSPLDEQPSHLAHEPTATLPTARSIGPSSTELDVRGDPLPLQSQTQRCQALARLTFSTTKWSCARAMRHSYPARGSGSLRQLHQEANTPLSRAGYRSRALLSRVDAAPLGSEPLRGALLRL